MTKRPPEMVELCAYEAIEIRGPHPSGKWVEREQAEAVIRSLRVKLFRERAARHVLRANAFHPLTGSLLALVHFKAAARFSRIADAIERGER